MMFTLDLHTRAQLHLHTPFIDHVWTFITSRLFGQMNKSVCLRNRCPLLCGPSNQKRAALKAQEKVETSSTKSTSTKVTAVERSSMRARRRHGGGKSPTRTSSSDDDEDSKAASSTPGRSLLIPWEQLGVMRGSHVAFMLSSTALGGLESKLKLLVTFWPLLECQN